eukprot:2148201-Prymnesium_polylepis.1
MASCALQCMLAPISSTFRKMQESVGVAPPTEKMAKEEDVKSCALLRLVPVLQDKIAWRSLGENFPTPVHESTVVTKSGAKVHFYVKREDLASKIYGGNKVRRPAPHCTRRTCS